MHFKHPSNDDSNDRDRCRKCGHGKYAHGPHGCEVSRCNCKAKA